MNKLELIESCMYKISQLKGDAWMKDSEWGESGIGMLENQSG